MKISDFKTRGQNVHIATDDNVSFVVRASLVRLGVGDTVAFSDDRSQVTLDGKTFKARFDEYNGVYDLASSETD